MKPYIIVAKRDEISSGMMKEVSVMGKTLVVANVKGQYFVLDGTCTHELGHLARGFLDDTSITCPVHGAIFDVRIGEVLALPATGSLHTYPVKVEGEFVKAQL